MLVDLLDSTFKISKKLFYYPKYIRRYYSLSKIEEIGGHFYFDDKNYEWKFGEMKKRQKRIFLDMIEVLELYR